MIFLGMYAKILWVYNICNMWIEWNSYERDIPKNTTEKPIASYKPTRADLDLATRLQQIHDMEAKDALKYKDTWLHIDSLAFSTWNDNAPMQVVKPGNWVYSDDSGRTFDLKWSLEGSYNAHPFQAEASLTHFTDWEIVPRWPNGEVYFGDIDSTNAERIDILQVGVKTRVFEIIDAQWGYIRANAWVGVEWLGNFWGGTVQKKWHDMNGYYVNNATYENIWNTFTPTVWGNVEAKKYILWDKTLGVYGLGKIDANIALNNNIWVNSVHWKIWVGTNIGRAKVELSHNEAFEDGAFNSRVYQWAMEDGHHQSYNAIDASMPIGKMDVFGSVTQAQNINTAWETGDKGEYWVNVGLKWNF